MYTFRNHTKNPIFDTFTSKYTEVFTSKCNILKKIQIDIITVENYLENRDGLPNIEGVEKEAMSYYITKEDKIINRKNTKAGIVVNQSLISNLGLSEEEQMACLAHEIGHFAFFFLENKDAYIEEIYADGYATLIGLEKALCSALRKLINSNIYCEEVIRDINSRIRCLEIKI